MVLTTAQDKRTNQLATLSQQTGDMYKRLRRLYASVEQSPESGPQLLPAVLKELAVATEILQVTTQALQRHSTEASVQAAASQRQHYQTLFDEASEAHLITDLEGKIQTANLAAARLLNVPQSLLINQLLISFVSPPARLHFRTELKQMQQLRQSWTWSICLKSCHAEPLDLSLLTAVMLDKDGHAAKLHWVLREVTEAQPLLPRSQPNGLSSSAHAAQQLTENLQLVSRKSAAAEAPSAKPQRSYQTYTRGEVIPLDHQTLWLVTEGLVKLTTLTDHSEEVLLGFVGPAMPLCSGPTALPVYQATALSTVRLVPMPLPEATTNPAVAQKLFLDLNRRLQQTELLMNVMGQRRVRDRLYALLKLLQQEVGQTVAEGTRLSVRLTHEDIATACCTTRVTITRLLGELQQQNQIVVDAKSHLILKESF